MLALERRRGVVLIKALARVFQYQRMLDQGRYASISEMSGAKRTGYLGTLLRLPLLAPDLVELVLDGRSRCSSGAVEPIPLEWPHQREHPLPGEPTRRAGPEVQIEA